MELSLHILETERKVIRCSHHHSNRDTSQNDISGSKRNWLLTGVPYAATAPAQTPPAGSLHCGCLINNVLLDFYMFKTGTLTSPSTQTSEDWRDQHPNPRVRELMLTQVRDETAWDLDNIWAYRQNDQGEWNVERSESARLEPMVVRLLLRLQSLQEKERIAAEYKVRVDSEKENQILQEMEEIVKRSDAAHKEQLAAAKVGSTVT